MPTPIFALVLAGLTAASGGSSASPSPAPDAVRAAPADSPCSGDGRDSAAGPALTPEERSARIERQLAEELAAFDALLLHERNAIAERQARDGAGPGHSGGATGTGAGDGKGGVGKGKATGGEGDSEAGGEDGAGRDLGGDAGGETEQTAGSGEAAGGGPSGWRTKSSGKKGGASTEGGSGSGGSGGVTAGEAGDDGAPGEAGGSGPSEARTPPDVGDGRDDDIVARQIREAAQAEPDPRLREKLWQEYRDYKASVRTGGGGGARGKEAH